MGCKRWTAGEMENQSGRVAIVTGSSSGIGFETARVLADNGATVIIAVRNLEKGSKAAEKIRQGSPSASLVVMALDLAELASVRAFGENFHKAYDRLDLLINNAGVMVPPYSKTVDGFELQFGTNHLGHFALTGLVLDLLKTTAGSRIVTVSSVAHKTGNIDFNDLNWEKRSYSAWQAYGDSKIANLYFTYELARKLGGDGTQPTVVAAHPGWTATDLQRHSGLADFMNQFLAQKISMGALPTLLAAIGPDVRNGEYYGPCGLLEMRGYPKKVPSNKRSHNAEIAGRLWEISEKLTGISFP